MQEESWKNEVKSMKTNQEETIEEFAELSICVIT